MATREQIEATYDYIDELWRLSMGENTDITGAMYGGDYTKSLEQAQHDKYEYILDGILFAAGKKVLDVGCGWGGFLKALNERGGQGVGLTLSYKQKQACEAAGAEVYLLDWKDMTVDTFG